MLSSVESADDRCSSVARRCDGELVRDTVPNGATNVTGVTSSRISCTNLWASDVEGLRVSHNHFIPLYCLQYIITYREVESYPTDVCATPANVVVAGICAGGICCAGLNDVGAVFAGCSSTGQCDCERELLKMSSFNKIKEKIYNYNN